MSRTVCLDHYEVVAPDFALCEVLPPDVEWLPDPEDYDPADLFPYLLPDLYEELE